jgi:alkylation response protein AidB-like acyl-CoA dehydrogenase
MERVLSTYPLLAALLDVDALGPDATPDPAALGGLLARLHTLRAVAVRIARSMDAGGAPIQQAALLKFLGTAFEGDVVDTAREQLHVSPDPDATGVEGLLARSITAVPGATIRGGTTEVLLTIVGRQELSPKRAPRAEPGPRDELRSAIADVLRGPRGEADPTTLGATWDTAVQLGWTTIGTDESAGGSGGEVHDLAEIATGLATAGRSAPVVETALAARVLAASGRTIEVAQPLTHALGGGITSTRDGDRLVLTGRQTRVPWARVAGAVVVRVTEGNEPVLVLVPTDTDGLTIEPGTDLAGRPRDTLVLDAVTLPASAVVGDAGAVVQARNLAGALTAAALLGSLRAAQVSVREHVTVREQFGKPLAVFQAVAHNVARLAAEVSLAETAVDEAVDEVAAGGPGWRVVVARIVTARAAGAVAKLAHQLLGAMGITREHDLHVATLALWSGRDEGTAEHVLAARLGAAATAAGPDTTWDWLVHETARIDGSRPWGEH